MKFDICIQMLTAQIPMDDFEMAQRPTVCSKNYAHDSYWVYYL